LNEKQNENLKDVRILAVSREASLLRLLWSLEAANGWHLETAANGWDAMERVQSGAQQRLLILDVPRGDAESLHFLRWLRRLKADLPVLLLCHPEEVAQGKEEIRKGAGAILTRPFDGKQLEFIVRRQFTPAADTEAEMMIRTIEPLSQDASFVSASLIMQKLRAQAALMAKTDVPVLILGERGSGKFTVATLIHNLSVRSGFQLCRVNCGQMPESVLESEILGGENGTLFLDEITALPTALQAKLVQVLQEQEARSAVSASAQVRILAASSMDIDRALSERRLREDLYYRLSAFTVHVPPMRQRRDEVAILLRCFMHKLAQHYSLPPRSYPAAVLEACQRYSWPGNLKEMETFVKRYLVAGDHELALREISLPSEAAAENVLHSMRWPVEFADEADSERHGAGRAEAQAEIAQTEIKEHPESLKSLIQGIKSEAEQNAIRAALKKTGWNRKAAARLLRVSYRTLLYKIEQYRMRAPEPFLPSFSAEELLSYEEVKGNGKAS
jgi:two-component system, NtrC family, response regulator AtoC